MSWRNAFTRLPTRNELIAILIFDTVFGVAAYADGQNGLAWFFGVLGAAGFIVLIGGQYR